MLNGAHAIIYSKRADEDRAFLRDVILLPADVGHGWLIYGLPPAEIAVHPGEKNDVHELYLMCDDVEAFVAEMQSRGVACSPVQALGWGMLTRSSCPAAGTSGSTAASRAAKADAVRATPRRASRRQEAEAADAAARLRRLERARPLAPAKRDPRSPRASAAR